MLGLFLLVVAGITAFVWIAGVLEVAARAYTIDYLRDQPLPDGPRPLLSVIVAARDEEVKIRAGLRTLLELEGVDAEIIVVDDRSSDGTGRILDEMAASCPRLRVVHLADLPDGWLGKNHALHAGAKMATAPWLLLTDADVCFEPTAAAKAIAYAEKRRIDHLAVTPELKMPGILTNLFGGTFVLLFTQYTKPWKARDPTSRHHIGIGAFNLVRREAYLAVEGHSAIRLRPDDDLMLGKLLKRAGFRQEVLYGRGELEVEWYGSIHEAVIGLEKNSFAGLNYSVPAAIFSLAALLLLIVWPPFGLFVTAGLARALNAVSYGLMMAVWIQSARVSGADPRLAPALPLGGVIVFYILTRAVVLTLWRDEIRWRGTAYPLSRLRQNKV